jgi:hypothetical protein
MSPAAWMCCCVSRMSPADAMRATPSKLLPTACQPMSRPPIGCSAVTSALCDRTISIAPASPLAMRFSAA